MKDIVIGTAGHIDHGKTTLVKYLTGKDCDTLPEEKKRGITIDLGFSYLKVSEDKKIGIVDVPGHEKFIKNMTAGISGTDYIILVVAGNDGVMPQTEEHFDIVKLLGIKHGIIVLTKCDLISESEKEKAREEIKNLVKDSFLENSEIFEVSIKNPDSYENLKKYILKDIEKIKTEENFSGRDFKMYVDRVFSVKGFGTVVTGTVLSGEVSVKDSLCLYPENIKVRVKGIENHGEKISKICAGNRCGLNLSGAEKNEIKRGDVLLSSENFISSKFIHIKFKPLENCSVKNNEKVKIYIGTREIKGKIRFFKSSCENLAELILDEEITGEFGEKGIIRGLSPVNTLGGFKILALSEKKAKLNDVSYMDTLLNLDKNIKIKENKNEKLIRILEEFHKNFPLKKGILTAELKNRYFSDFSVKEFKNILEENVLNENIKCERIFEKEYISLKNYKIKLGKDEKILKEKIFKIYKEGKFVPQRKADVKKIFLNEKNFEDIFNYLAENEMILYLQDDFYILKGFLKEAEKKIREFIFENKSINISETRKILDVKRIYALMILEKLDTLKITKRINNYRISEKEQEI